MMFVSSEILLYQNATSSAVKGVPPDHLCLLRREKVGWIQSLFRGQAVGAANTC
jgi:hypothetical protein